MVPSPLPSAMVALAGDESVTVNVSVDSIVVSPVTGTVMVCEVTPAAKVSVPEVVVKSLPAVALPFAVAYWTVTDEALAALRLAVNVKLVVPVLPSARVTSLMLSVGSGASSLVMVHVLTARAIVALVGLASVMKNVSSASTVVSPMTGTGIVRDVTPGANVRVPVLKLKSLPLAAVPFDVS